MTSGVAVPVALLAEGVDRNTRGRLHARQQPVALLAEGVDRNAACGQTVCCCIASPSSRRAWIEMHYYHAVNVSIAVALLAEGVDRNALMLVSPASSLASPSSRRAWIEITTR